MERSFAFSLVFLFSLTFAGLAGAHVTVQPEEVPANSFQVFTLRVPSEKDAFTMQVKLEVPDGVEVSRFEPKVDWNYETEKNTDGKIIAVIWKTAGHGLGPNEFGQFLFQGRVSSDGKELVWKAHQTYSDGTVVDWTGLPDSEKPASVTNVTKVLGGDGHGGDGAAAGPAADKAAEAAVDGEDGGDGTVTLALAIAGFTISVLALILVLVRKPGK